MYECTTKSRSKSSIFTITIYNNNIFYFYSPIRHFPIFLLFFTTFLIVSKFEDKSDRKYWVWATKSLQMRRLDANYFDNCSPSPFFWNISAASLCGRIFGVSLEVVVKELFFLLINGYSIPCTLLECSPFPRKHDIVVGKHWNIAGFGHNRQLLPIDCCVICFTG